MKRRITSIVDRRKKERIDTILYSNSTKPSIKTLGEFVTGIGGDYYARG